MRLGCLLLVLAPMAMCVPVCWVAGKSGNTTAVAERTIVEIDLQAAMAETDGGMSLSSFGSPPPTVRGTVLALERAAADPRVVGLFATIGGTSNGLAVASELRDAVLAFRTSGKPAVAFAETIGEFEPGTGGYYLASSFDEIVVQPLGQVALQGLSTEEPFAKQGLTDLGVDAHFAARKEYKNAINMFTENEPTAPQTEATLALLNSFERTIVAGIVAARQGPGAELMNQLLRTGPFSAEAALKLKLIDRVGFRDEARARFKDRFQVEGASFLWLHRYAERLTPSVVDGTAVAVITIAGEIKRGEAGFDPISGGADGAFASTIARDIRKAREDDDIKALLVRVDSPGGSVVASQTIARELDLAQRQGKKIVVSMSNLAASGGYWVAAQADRIVAQPGTITGSIGVFAGKFVTERLWQRLGVNWVVTATPGTDGTLSSTDADFSPEARAKLEGFVDEVYVAFLERVAKGRNMTTTQVDQLARGRIWSGADAKERGLVDVLGGMTTARAELRNVLGLPAEAPLELVNFPRSQSTWERVLALTIDDGDNSDAQAASHEPVMARAMRHAWVQAATWWQQQSATSMRAQTDVKGMP
jgi:protease IV